MVTFLGPVWFLYENRQAYIHLTLSFFPTPCDYSRMLTWGCSSHCWLSLSVPSAKQAKPASYQESLLLTLSPTSCFQVTVGHIEQSGQPSHSLSWVLDSHPCGKNGKCIQATSLPLIGAQGTFPVLDQATGVILVSAINLLFQASPICFSLTLTDVLPLAFFFPQLGRAKNSQHFSL